MIKLLSTLSIVFIIASCSSPTSNKDADPTPNDTIPSDTIIDRGSNSRDEVHTFLGTPVDDTPANDNIFERDQYIFSYDPDKNTTNWVAWELSDFWYGDEERFSGNFKIDPLLLDEWYKVRHSDYTNSGYDRGHLVRSEERTNNEEDNVSTFYTTNLLPMLPEINRWGAWVNLEYHMETFLKDNPNYTAQVYAGGIFTTDSTLKGEGVVPVPDTLWKVAIMHTGVISSESDMYVIAAKIPNHVSARDTDWEVYSTTIEDIETSTGYDLFFSVHDSIEEKIEIQPGNGELVSQPL
jgi:endonuclease G